FLEGTDDGGQFAQLLAFADVGDQRCPLDFFGLLYQVGEAGNQPDGQVVNTIKTQVLKRFESGSFAGTGHAGNDHQMGSALVHPRLGPTGALGFSRRRHWSDGTTKGFFGLPAKTSQVFTS